MDNPLDRFNVLFSRALPLADHDPVLVALRRIARVEVSKPRGSTTADGIVTIVADRIDAAFLKRSPRLRVIGNCAVGYDNIDVAEATRQGIVVCNTPDVLTNATAELTIALIFAAARRFKEGTEALRLQRFKGWDPSYLLGQELAGSRLGIIGYGRIGRAVGEKARALGMEVVTHTRTPRVGDPNVTLGDLLENSDVITIHCPLTEETRALLNRTTLGRMKKAPYLVNTVRGEIIDEKALLWALGKGLLRGAALDVFQHEPKLNAKLRAHPRVFVLPHVGSATLTARQGMARLAARAVLEVLSGRVPANRVN